MIEQLGFKKLNEECISTGLCFECGACELACPNGALKLRKYPWCRNPELISDCVSGECDRCYRACAARSVPLTAIETKSFGKTRQHCFPGRNGVYPNEHDENKCGIVKNVYTGVSLYKDAYDQAVSGGIASSIIINALEKGLIDGAVLAGFDPEVPYEAKAVVATTREAVIACAGSKYQPHPQLLGLRDAAKAGLKKIAITTTPCNALSLRKMMLDKDFEPLVGNVVLVISNICGAHWSRHGTENLIENWMGQKLEDVAAIKYRARPFPGEFSVTRKDGTTVGSGFVNNGGGLHQLAKFTPEECRYCLEKVASVADIVVGDTWHHPVLSPDLLGNYTDEEVAKDERIALARKGMTALVVRSDVGQKFVDSAIEANAIRLFKETEEVGRQFLCAVHDLGKPVCNGPVINTRIVRNQPVREYF